MAHPVDPAAAILFEPVAPLAPLRLFFTSSTGVRMPVPMHSFRPEQRAAIDQALTRLAARAGRGDDFEVNLSEMLGMIGNQVHCSLDSDEDLQDVQLIKTTLFEAFPKMIGMNSYRRGERTHEHAPLGLKKEKQFYALNNLPHGRTLLEQCLGDDPLPPVVGPPRPGDLSRNERITRTENLMASQLLLDQIGLRLHDLKEKTQRDLQEPNLPEERRRVLQSHLTQVTQAHNYFVNELDRFAVQFTAIHQGVPVADQMDKSQALIRGVNPGYTGILSDAEKVAEEKYVKELSVVGITGRVEFYNVCKALKIDETRQGEESYLIEAVRHLVLQGRAGLALTINDFNHLREAIARIPCLRFLETLDEASRTGFIERIILPCFAFAQQMPAKRDAVLNLPDDSNNANLLEVMNRVVPVAPGAAPHMAAPVLPHPAPPVPPATGWRGAWERANRGDIFPLRR